jgi:hypothetical protein
MSSENEMARLAVDICFQILENTDRVCLKRFMKKYFVMN